MSGGRPLHHHQARSFQGVGDFELSGGAQGSVIRLIARLIPVGGKRVIIKQLSIQKSGRELTQPRAKSPLTCLRPEREDTPVSLDGPSRASCFAQVACFLLADSTPGIPDGRDVVMSLLMRNQ
jgi:hypothetical protein